ncbi:MAG: protein kinase domain-containing protein [Myxococcota bacterium]
MIAPQEQQFGKYRIMKRLGSGGMAEVHLARMTGSEGFERLVALKRILPHLCDDQDFIESFISEARLGGLLNHVNIVQTIELGKADERFYLAMEFVDGLTLAQLLRLRREQGKAIPMSVALEIAKQLCAALDYAHSAKDTRQQPLRMIHRDIKPDNILLSRQGDVKLTDFGVAKAATASRKTDVEVVKGTVAYMSPEQAQGVVLDPRSDLYSLGSVLFEMLTLEALYPDAKGYAGLFVVQKGDVSTRLAQLEAFPVALQRFMTQLLSAEREQRFTTALEVKHALLGVLAGLAPVNLRLEDVVEEALEQKNQQQHKTWAVQFGEGRAVPLGDEGLPRKAEPAPTIVKPLQNLAGMGSGPESLVAPPTPHLQDPIQRMTPPRGERGLSPARISGLQPPLLAPQPPHVPEEEDESAAQATLVNPLRVSGGSDGRSARARLHDAEGTPPPNFATPKTSTSDMGLPEDERTEKAAGPGLFTSEGPASPSSEPHTATTVTTVPSVPARSSLPRGLMAGALTVLVLALAVLGWFTSSGEPTSSATPPNGDATASSQAGTAASPSTSEQAPVSGEIPGAKQQELPTGADATPKKDVVSTPVVSTPEVTTPVVTTPVVVAPKGKAPADGAGNAPNATTAAPKAPEQKPAPAVSGTTSDKGATARTARPTPAPSREQGSFSVNSRPYSVVYLKKGMKKLGETPLSKIKLPVGSHELVFVTEDGARTTRKVEISANQDTRLEPVIF